MPRCCAHNYFSMLVCEMLICLFTCFKKVTVRRFIVEQLIADQTSSPLPPALRLPRATATITRESLTQV